MTSGQSSVATSDPNLSSIKEDHLHHEEHHPILSVIDDPRQTKWQTMRRRPMATFWIAALIFSLCMSGFDTQAGLGVLGIRQFRADFGHPYKGDYVIPASWLSAFNGGTLATGIIGAAVGSWMSDREYSDHRFCLASLVLIWMIQDLVERKSSSQALQTL